MRTGYRKIIRALLLLLVFAAAFPFVYPMKDGKPLLSLDRIKLPAMPDITLPDVSLPSTQEESAAVPVIVYKWQDAEGSWHFSNEPPPPGVAYQTTELEPNANLIQGVKAAPSPSADRNGGHQGTDKELVFGYSPEKVGEMMEKTRQVKEALEQRQRAQQELIE